MEIWRGGMKSIDHNFRKRWIAAASNNYRKKKGVFGWDGSTFALDFVYFQKLGKYELKLFPVLWDYL